MHCFMQPHLASGLLWWRGREESAGTSKPSVVETKVAHRFGSKALVGTRGPDGPEPSKGLPIKVAGLGVVCLFLQGVYLHAQS
jgi:hypothetical protein